MIERRNGLKDVSMAYCTILAKLQYVVSIHYIFCTDTKASEKLSGLLTNTTLCKDIMRLSPIHQTSALESFHSVIIHFAPKYVPLSFLGMKCR